MVGLIAFVGAALGSMLGYLGAARATRVERLARSREEWGRRFTHALELSLSDRGPARRPGLLLLVLLSRSELASDEERDYARAVIAEIARVDESRQSRTMDSEGGIGDATDGRE